MTDTRTALVIGGGIAGLSAAMALQQAGIVRNTGRASTGGKMFMIFGKRAFFG